MKVFDSTTEKFWVLVICLTTAYGCFSSLSHEIDIEQETLSKEESRAGLPEKMAATQNGGKYRTAPDKIRFDDHPGLENVL